jgi:hypothetical protein
MRWDEVKAQVTNLQGLGRLLDGVAHQRGQVRCRLRHSAHPQLLHDGQAEAASVLDVLGDALHQALDRLVEAALRQLDEQRTEEGGSPCQHAVRGTGGGQEA